MAALGLALFTISSPATGHPGAPVPTAGFHNIFALTTGQPQVNSRGDLDDS
jgi:hypothetical protein